MLYHFIYKTTNLVNGKYYYGVHSTNDLNDGYLGSGKLLQKAVLKYGSDSFKREILALFDTRKEAFVAENNIVTKDVIEDDNCYNVALGGGGPRTIKFHERKPRKKEAPKHILKGDLRTEDQKKASSEHSERMKKRVAYNRKPVVLFGKSFDTVTSAIKYFDLSTTQYYFLKTSDIEFETADQLKEYIWEQRSRNISKNHYKKKTSDANFEMGG